MIDKNLLFTCLACILLLAPTAAHSRNPGDPLHLSLSTNSPGEFYWQVAPGQYSRVDCSTNLLDASTWTPVGLSTSMPTETWFMGDDQDFAVFRVKEIDRNSPEDADEDELNDLLELNMVALDPLNPDSNGNGVNDGNEDADGDMASNAQEAAAGTDLNNPKEFPDEDHDGLPDPWELIYFPSIAAQDGAGNPDNDLLSNLQEYQLRLNPTMDLTDTVHRDGHHDQDNDAVLDIWELEDGTDPFDNGDRDLKGNYMLATARIDRQQSWGLLYDPLGYSSASMYAEYMKGTRFTLRASGYETAEQGMFLGIGFKRGVINEVSTDTHSLLSIGDGGYFVANHMMFLRKGVKYDAEFTTTNPYLPYVSAYVRWTPIGGGGYPYSTQNSDEPDNRLILQEVYNRQWYRTSDTGTTVIPLETITPDPDPYNTVFTLSGIAATGQGPASSTSLFPSGQVNVIKAGFIDDEPNYSLKYNHTHPESDNFFLRERDGSEISDSNDLDIYYRILPENLPVSDVKIIVYDGTYSTPLAELGGEKEDVDYKAGDGLHIQWTPEDLFASEYDEGFYPLQLEVYIEGKEEPIYQSSIESAHGATAEYKVVTYFDVVDMLPVVNIVEGNGVTLDHKGSRKSFGFYRKETLVSVSFPQE